MKKLFVLALFPMLAHAWEPTKTVDVVIPFGPGNMQELTFRTITKESGNKNKFALLYKPGAGGSIGNDYVNKQKPDGYTLGITSVPALGLTDKLMLQNKDFSAKDFTYVATLGSVPMSIVARPEDPVNNIKDLAKVLKNEKTTMGDPGAAARVVYELLAQHVGFKEGTDAVVRAEYKSPADTLNDVMGGHVRFGIMPVTISSQAHLAGKVKIIAVTSSHEIKALPGVKTVSSVYPDFVYNLDVIAVLPPNTPSDVTEWYAREINSGIAKKEVIESLESNYVFVNKKLLNPKELTKYTLDFEKRYSPIAEKVLKTQK